MSFFGPADLLVALNPWFAATAVFWLYPGIALLIGFIVSVFLRWPSEVNANGNARLGKLATIASGVGLVFAIPWIYGILHVALVGLP